jgi:hypothetical protein
MDVVLACYNSLREEVLLWSRSELRAIIILFSIDNIGIVSAFIYQKYTLFLLIPPITFLGTWLWLADHCMIRTLSAYISEEIEKKRIVELIGKTTEKALWVGWDSFVHEMPNQLQERGADRTTLVCLLLWINTLLPVGFAAYFLWDEFKNNYILFSLCIVYGFFLIGISIHIANLAKSDFRKLIQPNVVCHK